MKKKGSCLTWCLLLLFWPISLTIWIWKSGKVASTKGKIGLTVAFWGCILLLASGMSGTGQSKESTTANTEAAAEVSTEDTASSEEATQEKDEKQELKDKLKKEYGVIQLAPPENDKTGNLRVAGYTAAVAPQDIAAEYYKAYFESDSEIHCLWSNAYNTISRIALLDANTLDVTVHEYRDKEEHYADQILGGQVYEQYWVHLDTGEIEKIDTEE